MNPIPDMSTTKTLERFSREAAAGYDRQIIDQALVVLVGCGALGQFLALAIALIGFPKVVFIDMDVFEESNITRSPFYRQGQNKAKATAMGARALCTSLGLVCYRYATTMVQWLGDALWGSRSTPAIVLAAVDNQPARQWLSRRCRAAGVPLIEGGFHAARWNLSVFPNEKEGEPCWSCDKPELQAARVFSCDFYARTATKAGLIPATAPGAMSLASWQIEAAIALLHGDATLANCTVFGDLRSGTAQVMKRMPNPECPSDHRIIASEAVKLTSGPSDSVEALLTETERLVGDPMIDLPASFIDSAPCAVCHRPTLIELPEWAIASTPTCADCGGPFSANAELVAEQHGSLSWPTSQAILKTPLAKLGLGPGSLLSVTGSSKSLAVALAGDLDSMLIPA